jgi:hypothetical protein
MTDVTAERAPNVLENEHLLEFGGLRFNVAFTIGRGPTTSVWGKVDGVWTEMFKFDEFAGGPHFHVPANSKPVRVDREALGEPHLWYLSLLRDHLSTLIELSGFAKVLSSVDADDVAANIGEIAAAMDDCMPEDFSRVPGIGMQRTSLTA